MDKFYVKPKRNLVLTNASSSRVATSSSSRTSAEIFQSTSNSRRLAVGNLCSKIRHKIEDNLTPKISGKLYKTGKHSKSLTALSSIDPKNDGMVEWLNALPSRDENWKAKLAKMKAKVGFKAAVRVATITSRLDRSIDDVTTLFQFPIVKASSCMMRPK